MRTRNHPAPQLIQEDPLDEHVSQVEFKVAFTTLANSVATHNACPAAISANPVANTIAAWIQDFN